MPDTEILFCKKCHRFITQYISDEKGIQLFKNGKPYGALYSNNFFQIEGGSEFTKGFPIRCPVGHANFIGDSDEFLEEQERVRYLYGTTCFFHHREGAICDRKQECKTCIVMQNYQVVK